VFDILNAELVIYFGFQMLDFGSIATLGAHILKPLFIPKSEIPYLQ